MSIYYHYTNNVGFAGIIQSKEIWLTQVNRPDDPLEATITKEELFSLLDYYSDSYHCVNLIKNRLDESHINRLNKKLRSTQYAFSLTKLRDNATHWATYGDNGQGLCIGFDLDKMKPLLKAGTVFGNSFRLLTPHADPLVFVEEEYLHDRLLHIGLPLPGA